jgi:hypothetical protein
MKKLTKFVEYIFLGLLFYMPLHIFISTWVGSTFGILGFTKSLKDIVLFVGLLITIALWLRSTGVSKKRKLAQDKLFIIMGCYSILTLLLAIVMPTDETSEILGVVYNLRFFAMFVYGALLLDIKGTAEDRGLLQKRSVTAVLVSAGVVVSFGIIQYLILPNDFLSHFGYSVQNGVFPAFFIDNKPDLERIMSTIRDPNSLGSYLMIILSLCFAWYITKNKPKPYNKPNMWVNILLLMTMISLWFSFSRSAWIGAVLAVTIILKLQNGKSKNVSQNKKSYYKRPIALFLSSIITIALVGTLMSVKDTYFVQNIVLHADESTTLEDPNELRIKFIKQSFVDIAENPEGLGPGRAGLASIKNKKQGTILNENYYLQIATETGVIGVILFILINFMVLKRLLTLYLIKNNWVLLALFASGFGLFFTNLLVHIWSNEAVAYTWWGLSGIYLFADTKQKSKLQNHNHQNDNI